MPIHHLLPDSPLPRPRDAQSLLRRGIDYGWISATASDPVPAPKDAGLAWCRHEPVFLPGLLRDALPAIRSELTRSSDLMEAVRDGESLAELLEQDSYRSAWEGCFHLAGAGFEDNDEQGIEKALFDVWQGDELVAEDLWCKASWLSFDDEDGSVRFRFSFGTEGFENVAADPVRQRWAARLTDAIFPEGRAITENPALGAYLKAALGCRRLEFTERIVYFNAPNGGAQLHHDVERGHAGVLFVQMTGATFWLALSKPVLMDEMRSFLAETPDTAWTELKLLAADTAALAAHLDEPEHEMAEALIDHDPAFLHHLVERGHARILHPGDVLLLPQASLETCVWHSVFCLDEETGEGLSFAMKTD